MAASATTVEPQPPQAVGEEVPPVLSFGSCAIAFHLAASWSDGTPPVEGRNERERAMESYQDDMLLYAHRDDPPFLTRVSTRHETVTVRFPAALTYEAEGRRKEVRCYGATDDGRVRRFELRLGQTWFERSQIGVLTIVLVPPEPSSPESELNEYDLIKLVKLWEGGEAVSGGPSIDEAGALWSVAGDALDGLAGRAFQGWNPLRYDVGSADSLTAARAAYRVGTLELELPPSEWRHELFEDIARLKRRREAPDREDGQRWSRVVAVGGVLQGLLDFRAIKDDELADVFAAVDVNAVDETMRAFHKGTLLSLATEAEPDKSGEGRATTVSDRGRPVPRGPEHRPAAQRAATQDRTAP